MSNDLTLFQGGVPTFLKGETDSITSSLAGGGNNSRRISIKGGVFREMVGGKEDRVSEGRSMNVIIINAAPKVSRTYYEGTYAEGSTVAPACWSSDNQRPDAAVKNKQSNDCLHCPQNIKGSGQGDSRACRYSQRLAVMIEGETEQEHVYQLVLPATSIFGEGDKNKMPLQQYAKFLSGRGFPIFGVVTEMKFDIDSPTPKLVFKAVRPVTEEEYTTVKRMMTSEEAIKAITLTVAQTDGVKDSSEGFETVAKPRANALAAPKAKAEPEDPIEEPKKASSKKPAAPVQQEASLGELVNEWDD